MIVQILDKFGKVIRRKRFTDVRKCCSWVECYRKEIDRTGYSIEIFYE